MSWITRHAVKRAIEVLLTDARRRCPRLRCTDIQRWDYGIVSQFGEVSIVIKLDGATLTDDDDARTPGEPKT